MQRERDDLMASGGMREYYGNYGTGANADAGVWNSRMGWQGFDGGQDEGNLGGGGMQAMDPERYDNTRRWVGEQPTLPSRFSG